MRPVRGAMSPAGSEDAGRASSRVLETRLSTLCRGELKTTYGTDFDCIARTILDQKYERAVVITDGYGSLSEVNATKLKDQGTKILSILFDGKESCEELARFGEVVGLKEIVE